MKTNNESAILNLSNRLLIKSRYLWNQTTQRSYQVSQYSGSSNSVYTCGFSLRQLNDSAVDCITVRRSQDNRLLTIGFKNGELDTDKLLDFCGSGSGFVQTWFNQFPAFTPSYGGTKILNQGTLTKQPRIVDSGVLETVNGKPSLFFDGINNSMTAALNPFTQGSKTYFASLVYKPTNNVTVNSGTMCLFSSRSNDATAVGSYRIGTPTQSHQFIGRGSLNLFSDSFNITNSTLSCVSVYYYQILIPNSAVGEYFFNNVSQGIPTYGTQGYIQNDNDILHVNTVGSRFSSSATIESEFYSGHLSELLFFSREQYSGSLSRVVDPITIDSDRNFVALNQMAYYGIV